MDLIQGSYRSGKLRKKISTNFCRHVLYHCFSSGWKFEKSRLPAYRLFFPLSDAKTPKAVSFVIFEKKVQNKRGVLRRSKSWLSLISGSLQAPTMREKPRNGSWARSDHTAILPACLLSPVTSSVTRYPFNLFLVFNMYHVTNYECLITVTIHRFDTWY